VYIQSILFFSSNSFDRRISVSIVVTWNFYRRAVSACVFAGAMAWASAACHAQIAFDTADDAVYANGWQEGDDGGIGSFGPWSFDGTGPSAVQQRMDDGLKSGAVGSSAFNNLGKSWSLYNPAAGDFAHAGRRLGPLQVGQTVRVVIDNPIAREAFRGYSIKFNTGGGNICISGCAPGPVLKYKIERLENFNNGQWTDTNGNLALLDSDTDGGARIDFKLSSTTTYELKMTPLDNPAAAVTTTGSLSNPASAAPIDWIEFQFFNTPTSASTNTDFYIKSMQIIAAPPPVPGDYNRNGTVDAADYVLWRKHAGQNHQLANEVSNVTPGHVTTEDYAAWRARFGSRAAGAASAAMIGDAVPEPNVLALLAAGLIWAVSSQRPGRSRGFSPFRRESA
jgi:hypothetical protein